MKRQFQIVFLHVVLLAVAKVETADATPSILVSNVWNTGVRTYPASNDTNSPHSEMGVDYNSSGDLESAWFNSGYTMTATPGHLVTTLPANGTSSASWTTYFTPEGSEVILAGAGDQLKVTWVFTPSGVNTNNTSQNFRLAVVDTPATNRLTADGAPTSAAYTGYAMFMNMGQTLGSSNPFQLMERSPDSGNLLSSSGNWISLANGATSGNHGYDSGTQYTLVMTFTRNASNALDITAATTGGTLNGSGTASLSFTDSTPNSFTYDTFSLRPSSASTTAGQFDTTLFSVEFTPGASSPSITAHPQNRTVYVGESANFAVSAAGTAPLFYQWYFNTNTALPNQTNASLTLANVQTTNAGGYTVVVTNTYGSVTSAMATLTVNALTAPAITHQPQSQTAYVGQNPTFTVLVTGKTPSYQWYFNTNTLLTGATNATLTLNNVQTNHAGGYSVVVTNSLGSATSVFATLTIIPFVPNFDLVGFATLDGFASNNTLHVGGTTGGAGGAHVQVWDATNLFFYLSSSNTMPLVVEVMTNIDLGVPLLANGVRQPTNSPFIVGRIDISTDKTVYSKSGFTISHGIFRVSARQNVIIRNLKFRDLYEFDPSGAYDLYGWDYISIISGSHHVWVDHCDFQQAYDGMIDITIASDYVTASWNVFRDHKKCNLVSASDDASNDIGHLNVTFHHNWYTNVQSRTPFMRFGNAHVFNLYSDRLGGSGIQSHISARILVENSYFTNNNGGVPVVADTGGTVFVTNSIGITTNLNDPGFSFNAPFVTNQAPYFYTLDPVEMVPAIVTKYAGVEKLAPSLTVQPHSQTVAAGQDITFSVVAMGDQPLACQWWRNGTNSLTDGDDVSGATSGALTLTNVQVADAGDYTVVVTNAYGSVTSAVATLTVVFEPPYLMAPVLLSNGAFQFEFTSAPGAAFSVVATTNLALGSSNWTLAGSPLEGPPGSFQFTDPSATNYLQRFYRLRWP